MNRTGKAYVARNPACGCIVAAVVEDGKSAAYYVSQWIKAGYVIDRVDNDVVREKLWVTCPLCERDEAGHDAPPSQPVQARLF